MLQNVESGFSTESRSRGHKSRGHTNSWLRPSFFSPDSGTNGDFFLGVCLIKSDYWVPYKSPKFRANAKDGKKGTYLWSGWELSLLVFSVPRQSLFHCEAAPRASLGMEVLGNWPTITRFLMHRALNLNVHSQHIQKLCSFLSRQVSNATQRLRLGKMI